MRVIFRTDASHQIGTGHVMRCLTLAQVLRERGAECRFVCRDHPGNLIALICEQGFETDVLPLGEQGTREGSQPEEPVLAHAAWLGGDWHHDAAATIDALEGSAPDWLIIDHYALDAGWESALRPHVGRIMVIDDLADRPHDCDLLLDQNLVADMAHRYDGKLPAHCGRMLGPVHALLQPQYADLHTRTPPREGPVQRALVYFGGADTENLTGRAIAAFVCLQREDLALDVVINPSSLHSEEVREQVRGHPNITLHEGVPSLAPLMVKADLAIGAGGATTWERCCLGLPALVITIAENQKAVARELAQRGLIRWLGDANEVREPQLVEILEKILDSGLDPTWAHNCQQLVDGKGAQRVLEAILGSTQALEDSVDELGKLRPIRSEELELMLEWRNAPSVRANMYTTHVISLDEHMNWWGRTEAAGDRQYFMYEHQGTPTGIVGFTDINNSNKNSCWAFYASPSAPKGTGSRMEYLALERAFKALELHKLYCEVLAFNSPVIKLHQKFGFEVEGILREQYRREDEYIDIYRLGILAHEWAAKAPELREKLIKMSKA